MAITQHPAHTSCPITGKHSWIEPTVLLVAVLLSGCGGRAPAPTADVLIYCPATLKALAQRVSGRLAAGSDVNVRLAPVRPSHVVSTVMGLRKGDFVVCTEGRISTALTEAGLVKRSYDVGRLELGVVARAETSLAALTADGAALGAGAREGSLGQALSRAIPAALRDPITANLRHRTERSGELVRLVGLGSLDAAFVWNTTDLPPGVAYYSVPELQSAGCPLLLLQLTCSQQPERTLATMHELLARGRQWLVPVSATALPEGATDGE
ncbi:MAG: hypothetical protein HN976_33095 [Lentisphaerae bacterium]|nr:hypothetical protein [Lentisphaerota bacterium]